MCHGLAHNFSALNPCRSCPCAAGSEFCATVPQGVGGLAHNSPFARQNLALNLPQLPRHAPEHLVPVAEPLLADLSRGTIIVADKAYDADWLRGHIKACGAIPNIPNMIRRKKRFRWTKALYRERNQIERFFNKLKQFRRIATRYDKLGASYLAFLQLATVRISLRLIESTP